MAIRNDEPQDRNDAKEENHASSLTCPKCGSTSWDIASIERRRCSQCQTFISGSATFLASMMRPSEEKLARHFRYAYVRMLQSERFLGVEMLSNHEAALKLCLYEESLSVEQVKDTWHYDQLVSAIVAASSWEPADTQEPFGWSLHRSSGRRRPFGNPAAEYASK